MKFQRRFSSTLLVLLTITSLVLIFALEATGAATTLTQEERQVAFDKLIEKWRGILGPINFGSEHDHVFQWFVGLHPQPTNVFHDFRGEILSNGIEVWHDRWFGEIFKDPLSEKFRATKPSKYYLNEGRTEPGLLYFELIYQETRVTVMEGGAQFLITIFPLANNSGRGFDGLTVAKIITNVINLKYSSAEEVVGAFKLPKKLEPGQVFRNSSEHPGLGSSWRDNILGFVSKDGVCLMIFKADENRPELGVRNDFDWLNKGLFMEDGKTLVDPPRKKTSKAKVGVMEPPKK